MGGSGQWHGILPAVTTKFNEDGALDARDR